MLLQRTDIPLRSGAWRFRVGYELHRQNAAPTPHSESCRARPSRYNLCDPVTFDDGPAKQVERDRELIVACDVARGVDSPPVLAAFEVLCHEETLVHRNSQIQRRN